MTEIEAIQARHSVRRYTSEPVSEAALDTLRAEVEKCNSEGNLHIQLVTDEPKAFSGIMSYGSFYGVLNYFVMAGPKDDGLDERIGYYGEKLVLLAQQLGLNTCWVGLTYKKVSGTYDLEKGEKVVCCIALGHGATAGVSHKVKTPEEVSNVGALTPDWFRKGVEAALLAPTAINQQKFRLEYMEGKDRARPAVSLRVAGVSLAGYTKVDLGIVRRNFEIGAGTDNFAWA